MEAREEERKNCAGNLKNICLHYYLWKASFDSRSADSVGIICLCAGALRYSHRGCQISPRDNLVLLSFEDERSGSGRGRKQNIRMACRRSSLNCLSLATSEEVEKIKTARNKKKNEERKKQEKEPEKRGSLNPLTLSIIGSFPPPSHFHSFSSPGLR